MKPDRLRAAVVGCGFASQRVYLPDLMSDERCELVGVCDVEEAVARNAAARFEAARWFTDTDVMLQELQPDLLVNVTPAAEHARINRLALSLGCHVYGEKPLATSVAESHELMAQARAAGRHLIAAPDVALRPAVRALRDVFASGVLGRPLSITARFAESLPPEAPVRSPWYYLDDGGGALADLGCYLVTALVAICGPVRRVGAFAAITFAERRIEGGTFRPSAEDTAAVLLEFDSGPTAVIQTGFHFAVGMGRLQFDLNGGQSAARLVGENFYDCVPQVNKDGAGWHDVPTGSYEPAETGVRNMIRCLLDKRDPDLSPTLALHVLEVLDAARESQRMGVHVTIGTS